MVYVEGALVRRLCEFSRHGKLRTKLVRQCSQVLHARLHFQSFRKHQILGLSSRFVYHLVEISLGFGGASHAATQRPVCVDTYAHNNVRVCDSNLQDPARVNFQLNPRYDDRKDPIKYVLSRK